MTTACLIPILLLAAVILGGCKEKSESAKPGPGAGVQGGPAGSVDTPESLVEELMTELRGYHAAIHRAADLASAQAAVQEMQEVTGQIEKLADRLSKLEVPSEEVRKQLGKRLRDSERKVNEELGDAEDKVESLDAESKAIMAKAMAEVGATMQQLLVVFGEYYDFRGGDE